MPRRIVIASATGFIAGAVFTIAVANGVPGEPPKDLILPLTVRLITVTCCLIAVAMIVRHILHEFTQQFRSEVAAAAEDRRLSEANLEVRRQLLAEREETLARTSTIAEGRLTALARRLEEAHDALLSSRADHDRLQDEHNELADDYNRLVMDVLQRGADRFRRHSSDRDGAREAVRTAVAVRGLGGVTHRTDRGAADQGRS